MQSSRAQTSRPLAITTSIMTSGSPASWKGAVVPVILLSLLIGAISERTYWAHAAPIFHFRDLERSGKATVGERRQAARMVLARFRRDHDAYHVLDEVGTPADVPLLIRSLRYEDHTEPGGIMVCSKAHCLEALRNLTGQKAGLNYEDWKKWWDEIGHVVPDRPSPTAREAVPGSSKPVLMNH